MIEMFREWVLSIVTIIIFLIIVEILIPSNKFKKYIKFVGGLIIMIVVISPVVGVINHGITLDDVTMQAFNQFELDDIQRNYDKYEAYQNFQIINIYEENLKEQIKERLLTIEGVYNVDVNLNIQKDINSDDFGNLLDIRGVIYTAGDEIVDINGKVKEVNISINNSDKNDKLKKNIEHNLIEIYQLPLDKINIKVL